MLVSLSNWCQGLRKSINWWYSMWWGAQCLSLMWHLLGGFWIDSQRIWMLVSWSHILFHVSFITIYFDSGHQDPIPCRGLWPVPFPDTVSGFDDLLLLSLVHNCLCDHHCQCCCPWLDHAIWSKGNKEARQPAKGEQWMIQEIKSKNKSRHLLFTT